MSDGWVRGRRGQCLVFATLLLVSSLSQAGTPPKAVCARVTIVGQVSAGGEWSTKLGEGWVIRVLPIAPSLAGYSGWDLVMDRDQPAGFPDALLLATMPYNSINEREIGTTFGDGTWHGSGSAWRKDRSRVARRAEHGALAGIAKARSDRRIAHSRCARCAGCGRSRALCPELGAGIVAHAASDRDGCWRTIQRTRNVELDAICRYVVATGKLGPLRRTFIPCAQLVRNRNCVCNAD